MVTMVIVCDLCCCKLLHMKVHRTLCWCVICHIQYYNSVSMVSMNMTCSFQYLPSQCQVMYLGSTNKIACIVYLVAMEDRIIGSYLCFDMLSYLVQWVNKWQNNVGWNTRYFSAPCVYCFTRSGSTPKNFDFSLWEFFFFLQVCFRHTHFNLV